MPDNNHLPSSKSKEGEAKTQRLLLSTIFVSAGSGGTFAAAVALWISERPEALVLFILFLSVLLYVTAEAGLGQMLIQSAKELSAGDQVERVD
jgi:hypothetical protein